MPTPRAVAYLQGRYLPSRRSNREFLLEIGGDTVMTSDLSWGTCRTRAHFILEIAATCVIILENPVRRQAAVFFYTRFQPGRGISYVVCTADANRGESTTAFQQFCCECVDVTVGGRVGRVQTIQGVLGSSVVFGNNEMSSSASVH